MDMSAGKTGISLAIVLFGIYALLDNLHLLSRNMLGWLHICIALIFLIMAVILLIRLLFQHRRSYLFWGLFLGIYGGLLLAGQLTQIDFQWQDFWKLWPFLIIYAGLSLLFDHSFLFDRPHHWRADPFRYWEAPHQSFGGRENGRMGFVNKSNFGQENWKVQPLSEHARVGDYNFDFTKAFIPEQTIPICLTGWVGNIKITVPEDLAFRVKVRARVGDIKIGKEKQNGMVHHVSYQTADYEEAVRRIDFEFYFQVIDLRINKV